jgi:hypothetical protein
VNAVGARWCVHCACLTAALLWGPAHKTSNLISTVRGAAAVAALKAHREQQHGQQSTREGQQLLAVTKRLQQLGRACRGMVGGFRRVAVVCSLCLVSSSAAWWASCRGLVAAI